MESFLLLLKSCDFYLSFFDTKATISVIDIIFNGQINILTPSARVPSTQGRSLADIYRVPASEFIIDNTEFSQCDLRILPFLALFFWKLALYSKINRQPCLLLFGNVFSRSIFEVFMFNIVFCVFYCRIFCMLGLVQILHQL